MLSTPGSNHSTHLSGSSPWLWKAALNTEGDVPAIMFAVQVTPGVGKPCYSIRVGEKMSKNLFH